MTVEIDLERAAEVTARLRRHSDEATAVAEHLVGLGHRMHLIAEVLPAVTVAHRLEEQLALTATLLTRRAEAARLADTDTDTDTDAGRRSFAGGTVLCSAIQLASPIPARPSTTGATGAIDAAGVARDAATLVDTAIGGASLAARMAPLAGLAAAIADLLLCRLGAGSGAAISTRKIVDEDGREVYEGSRSPHKHQTDNGEVLDSDPVRRDRQLWRVEHSNENGFLMEPYPGYPAYEVNAPRVESDDSTRQEPG